MNQQIAIVGYGLAGIVFAILVVLMLTVWRQRMRGSLLPVACIAGALWGTLSYIPFMNIVTGARLVITDSGGLQEETTYLNVPCLTLRENTERPVTVTQGTNKLVSVDTIAENLAQVLSGDWPSGVCPPFWDGHTAERAVEKLSERSLAAK